MSVDKILGGLLGGSGGAGGGDLGSILGQLGGGRSTQGGGGINPAILMALLPLVLGLLKGGGLEKILGGMRAKGLSAEADSWVGSGENQPVSGEQMREAAGPEVAQIAQQAGVSEDEAAEAMAQLLPGLVDSASPDGELAPQENVDSAFDQLQRSAAA